MLDILCILGKPLMNCYPRSLVSRICINSDVVSGVQTSSRTGMIISWTGSSEGTPSYSCHFLVCAVGGSWKFRLLAFLEVFGDDVADIDAILCVNTLRLFLVALVFTWSRTFHADLRMYLLWELSSRDI